MMLGESVHHWYKFSLLSMDVDSTYRVLMQIQQMYLTQFIFVIKLFLFFQKC